MMLKVLTRGCKLKGISSATNVDICGRNTDVDHEKKNCGIL